MNNKSLLIASVLIIYVLSGCHSINQSEDLLGPKAEDFGIDLNITAKKIIERYYKLPTANSNQDTGEPARITEYHFNPMGFITQLIRQDSYGAQYERYEYLYENKKYLAEINTYDGYNFLTEREVYHYTENHKLLEISQYRGTKELMSRKKYKYSQDYFSATYTLHLFDNEPSSGYEIYNKNGNCIEAFEYENDGSLDYGWIYIYNGALIVEERHYNSDSINDRTYKNNYDKKMRLQSGQSYEPPNTLKTKTKYKYDENNNPLEETTYDSEGILTKRIVYRYKYDKKRNWISCTIIIDDWPYNKRELIIDYY